MTAYQNAYFSMIRAVYGTVTSDSNQPLIKDFAAVTACVEFLGGQTEALENLVSIQTDRPGFSKEKAVKLSELSQLAGEVSGSVLSFGTASGNPRLAAKMDLPATSLSKGRDSKILAFCQNIYKTAAPLVGSLGEYKVTALKLELLKQKTDAYKELYTKPREAIVQRKAATKQLPVVLRRTSTLLRKRLDPLMVQFKASEPEFYGQYKAARRIVRPATNGEGNKKAQKPQAESQPASVNTAVLSKAA